MRKRQGLLLLAAFCICSTGCTRHQAAPAETQTAETAFSTGHTASETAQTSEQTVTNETTVTEPPAPEPEQIAEHLYRVKKLPEFEKISQQFYDGTAYYSNGLQTTVMGKTVDFSDYALGNCDVRYWLNLDRTVMYFAAANGERVYRSDPELHDPKLLFSNRYEFPDQENIRDLYLFPGSERVCFLGSKANKPCIGTLDPARGEPEFIPTADGSTMRTNTGVLFYDGWGKSKTVQYWEDGTVFRFDLQNKKEAENRKYISPNGKYLCTYLFGKTKDGFLTERFFIYDIKGCKLISGFDRVYETKGWDGAIFLGFDEDAARIYFERIDLGKFEFIEYRFGEE